MSPCLIAYAMTTTNIMQFRICGPTKKIRKATRRACCFERMKFAMPIRPKKYNARDLLYVSKSITV